MVHAGPVLDLCAYNADEWLRIRPGTSGALALGLIREILAQHPTAAALPDALTESAGALRALAATFTPERVESLTGIAPATVQRLAGELWDQRPSLVVVDERSLGFSNGLDTAMAALALNAVLGGFWDPAGGVRAAPEAPLAAWPPIALDPIAEAGLAHPRLDGAERFGRARSVHETLPEAIEDPTRTPEIALLFHANPAYARQQPARWRRALARIPNLVSFSPFRDETVDELATLVLPDHTYLERLELALPAPAIDRATVGARVPVIAPLHDTRATGDVVMDLVHRLGGAVGVALPWRSWRDALEDQLSGLVDARRGTPQATSAHGLFDRLAEVGFWVDDAPPAAAPVRVALRGTWAEPTWHGDAVRYPLGLLVYRPLGYAEGSGANQPWLRTLKPRPDAQPWSCHARLHPESAPGVATGDQLEVSSPWGAIRLPAILDERMEPGYVAVPMGGGHTAFGRWARGFGANVLDLVRPGPAPESGVDLLCATRVRIVKLAGGES